MCRIRKKIQNTMMKVSRGHFKHEKGSPSQQNSNIFCISKVFVLGVLSCFSKHCTNKIHGSKFCQASLEGRQTGKSWTEILDFSSIVVGFIQGLKSKIKFQKLRQSRQSFNTELQCDQKGRKQNEQTTVIYETWKNKRRQLNCLNQQTLK